jgi:hypothetical protein
MTEDVIRRYIQDEELVPANFGSVRDIARFVGEKHS